MKTDKALAVRNLLNVSLSFLVILLISNCNNKTKKTLVTPDSSDTILSTENTNSKIIFAVNGGGGAYTSTNGIIYQTDKNFSGGFTHQNDSPINNTEDDVLYQTGHFGIDFSYKIPLENGIYNITLAFIENYNSANSIRQFDVIAEGNEIISNLDIFKLAGKNTPYLENRKVVVKDDTLNLEFHSDKGDAMVSAFHIVRNALLETKYPNPVKPIKFAVNGGGTTYKASNGITYQESKNFSGGFSHRVTTPISNTSDDLLYQEGHYGSNFTFSVPLTNGKYNITFHFIENYNSSSNTRQFDVLAEGIEIIHNLDIFKVAGKGKTYNLTKTVSVKDSTLNLHFKADKGDAMVSAFYITEKF